VSARMVGTNTSANDFPAIVPLSPFDRRALAPHTPHWFSSSPWMHSVVRPILPEAILTCSCFVAIPDAAKYGTAAGQVAGSPDPMSGTRRDQLYG
jgi:hypothetical protein